MLQLINVTKTYKTKAGEVHALNGVSLTFPATGLIFITGKSGCGKTTLLNVIGGLDGIDGGEILVQDKKFSTFTPAEYDSYRNTFIGFIFQEYNLLGEFTVEKNIKIALELQGRTADEAEFSKLLKDVEIDDLKARHPSELSGGQRQRVAIARALVKQPRIIMADEPTGALDSNTGVQVLDTLKKLSRDKLVIVVSHDKEFAEKYADRVIHLVDGKVAQDVTFSETELPCNVNESENSLVVRDGATLSETEKETLARAVQQRKKIEIVENLSYRAKAPTDDISLPEAKPVALRKSKMKWTSSAQLGLKSVAVKPVRLIFTILISALAFAVFALFDTIANFNTQTLLKNQLKTSSSQTVVAHPNYVLDYQAGDSYDVKISQATVTALQSQTGGVVKGIFDFYDNTTGKVQQTSSITELLSREVVVGKRYYTNTVNGFVEFEIGKEIDENGNFKDFDYKIVHGKYPQLVYEEDVLIESSVYQVAISTYLADSILYYLNGEPLGQKPVATREDLLDATITINQKPYTVVGIVDCGKIPEKYNPLRETTPYNVQTNALLDDFNAYINAGAQKCLFAPQGFSTIVNEAESSADIFHVGNATWTLSLENATAKKQVESYLYCSQNYDANNVLRFDGEYGQSDEITLADNEILIHHLHLENVFATEISLANSTDRFYVRTLIEDMGLYSKEANRIALQEVFARLKINLTKGYLSSSIHQRFTQTGKKYEKEVKIVGVYFGVDSDNYTSSSRYKLMMNKNLMNELQVYSEQGDYCKLLFSAQSIRKGGDVIVDYLMRESGLALLLYNNSALNVIRANETTIRQVADLFLYVALALALFSVFMLYNYMSTSIASKKQSVGVLRALGAGGKDILRTFLTESLLISLVNGVLANAFALIGCSLVNAYILNIMNISVQFAIFTSRQIWIISVVSLLTAILSSALPIFKISKKKPVELIRRP